MTDYGSATLVRNDDNSVTVVHADPVVGMTRELFRQLRDEFRREDGYLQLDTAGRYVYRFHADIPSPYGIDQDVLVFTRVDPSELTSKVNLADDPQADTYNGNQERS